MGSRVVQAEPTRLIDLRYHERSAVAQRPGDLNHVAHQQGGIEVLRSREPDDNLA